MIVLGVVVAGGTGLFGIQRMVREITTRLRNEKEALLTAHQQAEVFINAVPSILIGVDHESRITRWNSTAADAFGLSGPAVVGKPLSVCGVRWLRSEMPYDSYSWCSERGSRKVGPCPCDI